MESYLSPASGDVSSAVVDQLAKTKGWTLFFSVMLWIGSGLMLFAGIALVGVGAVGGAAGAAFEEIGDEMGGMIGMILIGALYIVLAIIYIYPALKLSKFSSRCSQLINQPTETTLVGALNEMRAFWKFVGIWMIIFIALYPIVIIIAVAAGVMGATMGN